MSSQTAKWVLHIIPNTHWDREWYMSFESYRWRLVKLMDLLLDLMEKNPDYHTFTLDGQFLPIKDYLEIRPEKKTIIQELVKDGRLLIGPWYTQPLETLVCGESLVRNLLLGTRESRKYGSTLEVNYTIDQFGHISQMPQISCGFGLRDMVAWRGIPRGSRSTFEWVGADGSVVLMHYSNGGYGEATALPVALDDFTEVIDGTPFHRQGLKNRIDSLLRLRGPKAVTSHLLLLNGIDHSFAQSDLAEVIDKLNASIPGIHARHSSLGEYVSAVREECARQGIVLGKHYGEMFDPFESDILEPVHPIRAPQKIINNLCENLLVRWTEPFAAFAWLLGKPYPQAGIWKAWEYNLQNHAHDSLGGGSLDEVYRDVMRRYEWAYHLGSEIMQDSLLYLANATSLPATGERELALVVFNPLHYARSEVVSARVDIPKALGVKYPAITDGQSLLMADVRDLGDTVSLRYNPQRGHPTLIPVRRFDISFLATDVPALGYKTYVVVPADTPFSCAGSLLLSHNTAETGFVRLTVNETGTLDLTDLRTGRVYPGLHYFEDTGEAGSCYEHIAPEKDRIVSSLGTRCNVSIIEDSPLRAVFRIETVLDLPAALTADRVARTEQTVPCHIISLVTITAATPRVDILTTVENAARDHRLKVVFPTGITANKCWVEQPFDVIERSIKLPDLHEYPGEKPTPERPQQLFTDINDGIAGLLVANEGIYEYEARDDNARSLALTLLRCVDRIDMGTLGRVEDLRIPEAQCLGSHTFRYSLIPHAGSWRNGLGEALAFRFPMRAIVQKAPEEAVLPEYQQRCLQFQTIPLPPEMPAAHSFLEIEPSGLEVTAVKKHEDRESLVVRLLNRADHTIEGKLRLNVPGLVYKQAYRLDLNEERRQALQMDEKGRVVFSLESKRLLTVEIPATA